MPEYLRFDWRKQGTLVCGAGVQRFHFTACPLAAEAIVFLIWIRALCVCDDLSRGRAHEDRLL